MADLADEEDVVEVLADVEQEAGAAVDLALEEAVQRVLDVVDGAP